MNRKYLISLLFAVGAVLSFCSCEKNINAELIRRANNENYFESFADSVGYSKVSAPGIYGDGYIYMKYLEKGSDDAPKPIYTSAVEFRYMTYMTEYWLKDSSTAKPMDSNYDKQKLEPVLVKDNITGVSIALQNMKVGDHVRIAIPWHLAYGQNSYQGLQGYSSLFMDIKLISIN